MKAGILFLALIGFYTFAPIHLAAAQAPAQNAPVQIRYDARLTEFDYPYPVQIYSFSSQDEDDLEMAYMYLPARDPFMPVVTLLHGKNFAGYYWKETADYLQSLGYGVFIPDQIGFGKSSKPDEYQYSFAALATNTKNLMQSIGIEKTIVVGHSMGGMLAARFALLYPEATTKLILVNPIGLENYLQFTQYKDVDFFYQNELGQSPEKIKTYQRENYYDGDWNETYAALTVPLNGWVQGEDWEDIAYVNALTYDMIFTQPVIEEFKDFKVPATLIIGTRDRTGPGKAWMKDGVTRELGRYDQLGADVKIRNPEIEVLELDGLGHLPQVEDFTRFRTVFDQALKLKNTTE